MKILFLGGTGNISTACVELALDKGYDVTMLHRGKTTWDFSRPVESVIGDRKDPVFLGQVAKDGHYDVVANFIGYTPADVELDLAAFSGRTGQYIFVSTAAAYQKPANHYVITEATPLRNPFWDYAQNKIACEERLNRAYRDEGFPLTIVRPSYTFGPTWIPNAVAGHDYTSVDRMRRGLATISHGDGQSLWVVTYHTDFAVGFVGLCGNPHAIGEAVHITSDEVLSWDQIYRITASAAGAEAEILHLPSEVIGRYLPDRAASLMGDKRYSSVFDNSKIKRLVPEFRARVSFAEGIAKAIAWYDADPARQKADAETNRALDILADKAREMLG